MGLGSAFTSLTRAFRGPDVTRLDLRNTLESPSVPLSSAAAFSMAFGSGEPTASGEVVSEANALQISTVYACVRLLAESIGTIPLKIYERTETGRQEALDHSLSYIVGVEPSPEMTPVTLLETMVGCLALTGNAYAQIIRNKAGIVDAIYPLHPLLTTPIRLPDGTLAYETTDGMTNGAHRIIAAKDCIHVPLFSWGGIKGLSPIQLARQTLGLSQAALKQGARFFGNGSRPGGILTQKTLANGASPSLKPEQVQAMREFMETQSSGVNSGRIAVIPGDWTYTQLGMSLEDSQFLGTRGFLRNEIAALFRVDAHYVGDTTRQSNSNHEQASLSLLQDTLQPYIVKLEQEMNRKLLPSTARKASNFSLRFDLSERLRTDIKTTLESLAVGRQWGFYSSNDGRQILGLNPIGAQGDSYLDPINMIDAKKFLDWNPQKPGNSQTVEEKSTSTTEGHETGWEHSYTALIRDSLGRLAKRTNRSSETFTEILGPAYTTIAEQLLREARSVFALTSDWAPATDKLIKDCLSSTEHRSKSWAATQLDEVADLETNKIYRSLRINIFREAGAAVATKE